MAPATRSSSADLTPSTPGALIARVFWFMAGPLLLAVTVYGIVTHGGGWSTRWDVAFGVIVVLMLLARWLEHRAASTPRDEDAAVPEGTSAGGGAAADPVALRRYCLWLLGVAVGMWVVANVLGNHLLA
ncbi:MAG TPA: hypothetical protein PKK06_07870 [Phycisphaerae bacterium]|nr:hypothetical protein [Phycisphaerae bacterium]HNU46046.1 hypothetical protein [Phycisphaerae bacterium]